MSNVADAWANNSEEVGWPTPQESDLAHMSRRDRRLARTPYTASVPPFIAGLPVVVSSDVLGEAAEAAVALARFDAVTAGRLGDVEVSPLSAVLLRSESASSSQIEQITAGARALALASLGDATRSTNAALVAANAAAMERAVALSDELTPAAILDVHRALLHGAAPETTGRFRDRPVWIGGAGATPHSATFVAPSDERIPALIDDLVDFAHRTDVPPFVQLALAHAQFETIHPFEDGNGRTGRALVQAMLRGYGITERVTVPLSAGLLGEVEGYYEALTAYRRGELDPIVTSFSRAAFAAIANGQRLVDDLADLRERWTTQVQARRDASVWRLVPLVLSQPAVTVSHVAQKLDVTAPAAQTAIDQMVAAGALTPANANRRNRVWIATEVTAALDAFAERAGRRRFAPA